ncbi:N-acetyl-beta-hexosaminidase [Sinomicrobium soli]|nr:N-acetyl-beta-hexosaminidase [Sinomicrobium sp. N-1-3-6]
MLILVSGLNAQPSQRRTGDFDIRGFHLDLRIQVMTPEALKAFAKELSDFGINTLVMEWEATYPFREHLTITNKYSYSRKEIEDFIAYCNSLGIQVIPLQQSLGHVEYILRNARYSHLREDKKDISQLCPTLPEANRELFTSLLSDLAATHNSDYIHIGGDETYLLGHCERCAAKVAEKGKSALFVDHMKMIAQIVLDLGKTPVMWADIILKYPEAVKDLPAETVFVDWNYGWKINHFGDVAGLQDQGFTFWGAPAIRSHPDNWYVTAWKKHLENQKDFIPYARNAGYEGIVMTSWSTTGLYGFIWDVGYEVIDMVQIRNTYPLAGFRILVAAYARSLEQEAPIDPESFVYDYARERFGMDKKDAGKLWDFISAVPELIENGKPAYSKDITALKNKFLNIRNSLYECRVKTHKEEFEHFRLMADLRMHYLEFKEIEAAYNTPGLTEGQVPGLISRLNKVLNDGKVLNKRFETLMDGFLYPAGIREQNKWREAPLHVLSDRLNKRKK